MKKQVIIFCIALLSCKTIFAQWVNTTSGTANTLFDLFFFNADTGFVVGNNFTMQKTTNGGSIWAPINITTQPQINGAINGIDFNNNNGVAVGYFNNFACIKTNDKGNTWTTANLLNSAEINAVTFADASTIYSCGNNGRIFKSFNTGDTWNEATTNTTVTLSGIDFVNANLGYVAGDAGTILKTTDGGNNWDNVYTLGDSINFTALQFLNADSGFAVGTSSNNQSYLLATYDGGTTWLPPLNMQVKQLTDIYFANNNVGYAVGGSPTIGVNSQYIAKTNDNGFTWRQQIEANQQLIQSVFFVDENIGFAVGNNGIIIKTTTGGTTGIQETENKNLATIQPNPFSNMLQINLQKQDETQVAIIDLQGKIIQTISENTMSINLNTNMLESGFYILKVKQNQEVLFRKIVKQ